MGQEQRRLAAIVAADVVGYSRLMGSDEAGTLSALKGIRKDIVDPAIALHRGRIVKTTGDGLLLEFSSVVDAVRCAIKVQTDMAAQGADLPVDRRIAFRIGVNLGDVIIEGDDIFGDGVNVAARLEGIAEPGGLCLSDDALRQVRGKVDAAFDSLGPQALKNIAQPVHAWRWLPLAPSAQTPAPAALPLPDKPSIAVLPFQNMSGDPEQEYFADGVVEDIITALSRIKYLFVIARNSSFTYKGHAVDIRKVGRELGVRYVLEGSVRRLGSRVRVTGQLIDTATGAHLWADRFDGGIEDLFELQDQMAARITNALLPNLVLTEIERARHKPTDSLNAYDLYMRARASLLLGTRTGCEKALALSYRAIELDPNFAGAYGVAAWCYALSSKAYRWTTISDKDVAEVDRLARRIWALDQNDAGAVGVAGIALALVVQDIDAGAMYIERALTLNPNAALNWHNSGWIHIWLGQIELAIDHLQRAMRLSPLDPALFSMATGMAFAHYFAGRYDEASLWAAKALHGNPVYPIALSIGAAAAAMAGRSLDAKRLCARLQEVDPGLRLSNLKEMLGPYRDPDHPVRWAEGLRRAGLQE